MAPRPSPRWATESAMRPANPRTMTFATARAAIATRRGLMRGVMDRSARRGHDGGGDAAVLALAGRRQLALRCRACFRSQDRELVTRDRARRVSSRLAAKLRDEQSHLRVRHPHPARFGRVARTGVRDGAPRGRRRRPTARERRTQRTGAQRVQRGEVSSPGRCDLELACTSRAFGERVERFGVNVARAARAPSRPSARSPAVPER